MAQCKQQSDGRTIEQHVNLSFSRRTACKVSSAGASSLAQQLRDTVSGSPRLAPRALPLSCRRDRQAQGVPRCENDRRGRAPPVSISGVPAGALRPATRSSRVRTAARGALPRRTPSWRRRRNDRTSAWRSGARCVSPVGPRRCSSPEVAWPPEGFFISCL